MSEYYRNSRRVIYMKLQEKRKIGEEEAREIIGKE
jgi:hypothetical protein